MNRLTMRLRRKALPIAEPCKVSCWRSRNSLSGKALKTLQMELMREVILTRSRLVSSSYNRRPFGVSATRHVVNFAEARRAYPVYQRRAPSVALKPVCRNRIGTSRRGGPSIRIFRRNAALRHHGLYPVDIQSTRRQMVNVTSRKTDHIGNKRCSRCRLRQCFFINGSLTMPAKSLQRFTDELFDLSSTKTALLVVLSSTVGSAMQNIPLR